MIKKICLVTTEIPRPNTWDAHGAHFSALVTALAQEGHDVSIALVDSGKTSVREVESWQAFYHARKINLFRPSFDFEKIQAFADATRSYCLFQWLRTMIYDVVHFSDRAGLAYYSLLARHQGLAFESTDLVVNVVGGLARLKASIGEVFSSESDIVVDFLERESCRLAPLRVTSTAWEKSEIEKTFPTGETTFLSPLSIVDEDDTNGLERDSLVYCGHVSRNDDLNLFCDAIDALPPEEIAKLKIVFLGPSDPAEGEFSYLAARARRWSANYNIVSTKDRSEAFLFLRARARLAVLFPSLGHLAAAVTHCLHGGVHFVAARDAESAELAADPSELFFESTCDDLRSLIASRLMQIKNAKPKVDREATRKAWLELHSGSRGGPAAAAAPTPSVSVCLVHKDRPSLLRWALSSLAAQTFKDFEVIVVDNDSSDRSYIDQIESASAQFPFELTVIRSGQDCPNVARNLAAKHAKRSHLLFMDDDNLAKAIELEVFAKAAVHSDADIYTCAYTKFLDPHPEAEISTWLPIGPLLSLGLRYNVFGDTNFFVKRGVFLSLGGFVEKTFYGEDWEFLSRASFAGHVLEVVPEVLYFYREHSQNLTKRLSRVSRLRLRPYVEAAHPGMEAFLQVSAQNVSLLPSREKEVSQPGVERASIFLNREGLQSRITEVMDLETIQTPTSVSLTRAGADPRMMVSLPDEFEGALELEIWASAPRAQQLKVYWRKRNLLDYLEANSALVLVTEPNALARHSVVISDPARSGALRFDLEGQETVLDIHAIRINAMSTKKDMDDERILRAATDYASLLEDGGIYVSGVALDMASIRTKNCKIKKFPGLIEVMGETDDPQFDLSSVINTTYERLVVFVETESSPLGRFKIFWNEPHAVFSEERAVEFSLDPKGTRHAVLVSSANGIVGLRLDPIDTQGTTLIRKISVCTEDFLSNPTMSL